MESLTVLDHLKRFMRDYDIRGFLFTDDNFFVDTKRAYGILEEIVRADLGITLGKLQVRADIICKMEKDFFQLMVKAGVKRLHVGIESGSQRILDLINKNETIDKFLEANKKISAYPITALYTFMMGLPTETINEFAQSIRLATRLTDENTRAVKTFNIYTPYPGTKLYDTCRQLGLIPPKNLEGWASFNYRNIPKESTWISPEMKRMIRALDFPLMFLGKGHFITPYKKTNPVVVGLSRLYYPVAQYRVKHLDDRFPIESSLVKALGFFGRQD
jgi:anaerobic magnesium-protoporphyrin IX monomethyl ester cyclase